MATTYYDAEDFHQLQSGENPLKVSVFIGDGQNGGYLIFCKTELIGANTDGIIAKGSDCAGDWITVTATVKDVLEETNWTSVTVTLSEHGAAPEKFGPYRREVAQQLDTVCYTVKIKISL